MTENLICKNKRFGCPWTKIVLVNCSNKNQIRGGHIRNCLYDEGDSNCQTCSSNSSRDDPPAKLRKVVDPTDDEPQDDDNFDEELWDEEDQDESVDLVPENAINALRKALIDLKPEGLDSNGDLARVRDQIYWDKVGGEENDNRFHFGASSTKLFTFQKYWNFYQRIKFSCDVKGLKLRLGWVRDLQTGAPVTTTLGHSMDIFEVVQKLNLSHAEGDIILQLFRTWLKRYNLSMPIPKTCKSVCANIEKSLIKHYESELHYEAYTIKTLYPNLPEDHILIKAFEGWFALGVHVDVMAMLTELISYLNLSDVHTSFMEEVSESGMPVYSEPCSGNLTKQAFDYVKEHYHPDAFPFFLDLNLDDTPTKSMAKETICPYYGKLASVKVLSSAHPIFHLPFLLGFFPVSNWTDAQVLKKLMDEPYNLAKEVAKREYRYVQYKLRMVFTRRSLESLLQAQQFGCYLDFGLSSSIAGTNPGKGILEQEGIGVVDNGRDLGVGTQIVVPVVRVLANDNQQAHQLTGNTFSTKGSRNCRLCYMESKDFYRSDIRWTMDDYNQRMRAGEPTELFCQEGEKVRLDRLNTKGSKISHYQATILKTLTNYSLYGIQNPLYEVFRLFELLGVPFYVHFPPDRLHTVLKGPIQDLFNNDLRIIIELTKLIEFDVPGMENMIKPEPLHELERRVLEDVDFNAQPFNPTGTKANASSKFRNLSEIMGNSKTSTEQSVFNRGQIDGEDYAAHLFAVLIAIGHSGEVVPNVPLGPGKRDGSKVNPLELIEKAGWTALQVYWLISGDAIREEDVVSLEWLIPDLIAHYVALYEFRQCIIGGSLGELTVIKLHSMVHFCPLIRLLGAPKYWCSSIYEAMHKLIHNLFIGTSMRVQTRLLEIFRIFLGRRRVEFLRLAPGGEGIEDKVEETQYNEEEEEEEQKKEEEEDVVIKEEVFGEAAGSVSVSSNCRKHIAYCWGDDIGGWKFCSGAASSNRGRLTISQLYGRYLVLPPSTPYEEEDTYLSATDAKEALLLFPIVTVAEVTDAIEEYMSNRYASLEQEALQKLEAEDEYDRTSRRRRNKKKVVDADKLITEDRVLNLYASCKLGNRNASFMFLEFLRHYPPRFPDSVTPQWTSPASQQLAQERNFKGFMYYSTNEFGRSKGSGGKTKTGSSFIGLEGNRRTSATRRFDFVEVMFEDIRTGEMRPAYARIMAIVRLDSQSSSDVGVQTEAGDATFFYILWLEDAELHESAADVRELRKKYSNCPLRRMKYMCRPDKPYTLWFDIVGMDLITQPVCGYHDVDTRPSYDDEGRSIHSMKADRFFVLPLMNSKVCTRQYKHVIGWGDLLIKEDNLAFRNVGFSADIREQVQVYFKEYRDRLPKPVEKKKKNQKRKKS